MAWIFLAESAESHELSNLGLEPSPTVSETDMLKRFFCPECGAEHLSERLFGMTLLPCPEMSSGTWKLTSSSAGSPAKTSVLRELERAWQESEVVFSSRLLAWSRKSHPDSSFWKTSQPSVLAEGKPWLKLWPRSGMTVGGRLFQPQALELRTFASDGSFLPTPTASEGGSNKSLGANAKRRPTLSTMARRDLWPTPRASDGEKGGPNQAQNGVPSLPAKAVNYPTPAARDWKDGLTPRPHGRHSDSVAVAVAKRGHHGYLNPQFVEMLMGFKIGWTELDAWAMQWFRSKREKRSKISLATRSTIKERAE